MGYWGMNRNKAQGYMYVFENWMKIRNKKEDMTAPRYGGGEGLLYMKEGLERGKRQRHLGESRVGMTLSQAM